MRNEQWQAAQQTVASSRAQRTVAGGRAQRTLAAVCSVLRQARARAQAIRLARLADCCNYQNSTLQQLRRNCLPAASDCARLHVAVGVETKVGRVWSGELTQHLWSQTRRVMRSGRQRFSRTADCARAWPQACKVMDS